MLYWLEQLTEEIFERLKVDQDEASWWGHTLMSLASFCVSLPLQNGRLAELLVVHFRPEESTSALSRSFPLHPHSDPASVARSLWTAMMRGHSQPTSVDPAGRTPLTWSAHLCMPFRCLSYPSFCDLGPLAL